MQEKAQFRGYEARRARSQVASFIARQFTDRMTEKQLSEVVKAQSALDDARCKFTQVIGEVASEVMHGGVRAV